jgi:peptidoglycan/xylan/chitin deacetylase (PgdA/CDA1 family)
MKSKRSLTLIGAAWCTVFLTGCIPSQKTSQTESLHSDVLRAKSFKLKPGEVLLTFDDGPSEFTLRLARFLERHKIPAIYFMNYHNRDKRGSFRFMDTPEGESIVKDICSMSTQLVANHGDFHDKGSRKPEDFMRTAEALIRLCPRPNYFLRTPGGTWRASEKKPLNDAVIPGVNKRFGDVFIGPMNWDITGEDWSRECQKDITACRRSYVQKTVGREIQKCAGGIMLFHDVYASTMKLILGDNWEHVLDNPKSEIPVESMLFDLQMNRCKFVMPTAEQIREANVSEDAQE